MFTGWRSCLLEGKLCDDILKDRPDEELLLRNVWNQTENDDLGKVCISFRSKRAIHCYLEVCTPGDSIFSDLFIPKFWKSRFAFEKATSYTRKNVTFQERMVFHQSSNFFVRQGSCLGTFRFWKRLEKLSKAWCNWGMIWVMKNLATKKWEWICKFGMFEPPLTKRNKRSPFAVCTPAPYKRVGSLHPRDPITSWEW